MCTDREPCAIQLNSKLRQEQRDWLNVRNACATTACLYVAYADRISELKGTTAEEPAVQPKIPHQSGSEERNFRVEAGNVNLGVLVAIACSTSGYPVTEDASFVRSETKGTLKITEYRFPHGCGESDPDKDMFGSGFIISANDKEAWGFVYGKQGRKTLQEWASKL